MCTLKRKVENFYKEMNAKLFLITLLIAAHSIPAASQSLLVEAKSWHCIERMYYSDEPSVTDRPYTITVCGDTIVGETVCRKLSKVYHNEPEKPTYFAALEQDNCIYIVNADTQGAILDFNLSVGDADGIEGCVTAIDYITVNGIRSKRLTIERRGHLQYLVEGIGLSDDWQRYPIVNSYYNVFMSVELNGVTIFTAKDFSAGTTSVKLMEAQSGQQHPPTYGLSGKFVSSNVHGQIIIRDGKKIIQR